MADSSTVNGFRLRLVQSGTTLILYGISDYYNTFWANVTFGGSASGTKRIDWSGEGTKELHRWNPGTSTSSRTFTATINNDYPGYVSVSLTVPGVNPTAPPTLPSNVKFTRVSATEVTISFTKGARATSTRIDAKKDEGAWYNLANPTGTSQKVTGISANARYNINMMSIGAGGNSGWGPGYGAFYGKPPTPTNIRLAGSPTAVQVLFNSTAKYKGPVFVQVEGGATYEFAASAHTAGKVTLSGTFKGTDRFRVWVATPGDAQARGESSWSAWSPRVQDSLVAIPTLDAVAERSTGTTANPLGTNIRVVAKIAADTISGNKMTLKARYREKGASSWGAYTTNLNGVAASTTTRTFALSGVVSVLKSYEVEIVFSDSYSTTTQLVEVATGEVALSLAPNGVGVGKIWEKGALDVNGDAYFNNMIYAPLMSGSYTVTLPEFTSLATLSGLWYAYTGRGNAPVTVPSGYRVAYTAETGGLGFGQLSITGGRIQAWAFQWAQPPSGITVTVTWWVVPA